MTSDLPNLDQQIAYFEDRLRNDPGSRAFAALADLYRRTGELARAREILERGLEHHPKFVVARAALGLVHTEMGAGDLAGPQFAQVLEADPDNVIALRHSLLAAIDAADWARVRDMSTRLLRSTPDERWIRDALAEAQRRLEEMPAIAAPAPPQELPPAIPELTAVPVPPIAEPASPVPDAAKQAAAAVEMPATKRSSFETPTMAELYWRQGQPEKARAILERILEHDPAREDARAVLARIDGTDAPNSPEATSPAAKEGPPVDEVRNADQEPEDELQRFRSWLDGTSNSENPPT